MEVNTLSDKVLQILQTLVRMRSCEPDWDELDIVRYIESLFAPYHIYKNVILHGDNRASLIVSIEGKKKNGRKIAMMGHVDTMSPYNPPNWTFGPFSGHCVNGTIYGIGASNAKSGVASILAAALHLLENNLKPTSDLLLCFTADSDGMGIGAKTLLQGGFLSNVTEMLFSAPTGSDIVIAQKGVLWLDVEVKGHSRHIMETSQAVNALDGLVKFSEKLSACFKKIKEHNILGRCSVHLTQVQTQGNKIWMIPGEAFGGIDIRTTPSLYTEEACALIEDIRCGIEKAQPELSINVKITNKRPAVGMSADAPLVRRVENLCEKNGRKAKMIGQSFYTDASMIIPSLGIPFVVIGSGGKMFNDREDEHVALEDALFITKVYCDYMLGGDE